jgi:2-polyprenyl-6-methoxyphenol hydroxylase-like FAD-dependent oxidoreductase
MSSAKPVLISGAGIGGLLLAQSLRSHRIPFKLYERDTDGCSRSQGYRIRISVTAGWHDRLRPIFEEQIDDEAVFLKMSTSSPDGVPEWGNDPRVTLIGDAVHAMTPAGGVGANTALKDAAFLDRLLADAGGWKEGLTAEYEREMRAYASANVKMSFERASRLFTITELTKTI